MLFGKKIKTNVRCKAKLASEELLVRGAVVREKYVGCSLGRVIP